MTDEASKTVYNSESHRLDLIIFFLAFISGLILYITLHYLLRLNQWIVTFAIITVMVAYAISVAQIPLIRVRMDQAGDNAYYLGLLFTLISMSFALYEFGSDVSNSSSQVSGSNGTQLIIENFGIALFSTITGIFLRVFLHNMRIDPSDVEQRTRIELAEASTKVKANLNKMTIDLGVFHNEVRQRSEDLITQFSEDYRQIITKLTGDVALTSKQMIESVGNAHKRIMDQLDDLTKLIGKTANEAVGAINRLSAVAPPPLVLSRRLEKVSQSLETTGDKTELIVIRMQETAELAAKVVGDVTQISSSFEKIGKQVEQSQSQASQNMVDLVQQVTASLDVLGKRLEQDRQLLLQLQEQSRQSIFESTRSHDSAVEVLKRLTELTKGFVNVLSASREGK